MPSGSHRPPRHGYRHPRGEQHHTTRASDTDVALVRDLYELHGIGYGELAKKFDVTRNTIRSWCIYRTRVQGLGHCPKNLKTRTAGKLKEEI